VNGNVIVNANQTQVESRNQAIELNFTDKSYQAGERVEMQISSDQLNDLIGLQFTLNTAGLELIDVVGNGIEFNESNYAPLTKNVTTFSWSSSETIDTEELITLNFLALQDGTLSNNVIISSDVTSAEAYFGDSYNRSPITLIGRNNSEQEFSLFQNNPNPFKGSTAISFNVPAKTNATLSVLDINGKVIWSVNKDFNKGLNSIEIDENTINVSGVLYYRLDAGDFSATKKMIRIE